MTLTLQIQCSTRKRAIFFLTRHRNYSYTIFLECWVVEFKLLLSMLFWVPSSCHLEFSFLRSTKQIFMEKVPNSTPSKRSLETWAQIMKTLNWFHSIQHPKDSLESKSMAPILKNDFNSRLCSNGARSPEATNIWPQATENIWLVLVYSFADSKEIVKLYR